MKMSPFWFTVPENLPSLPAEEQVAWIAVLASRHKGEAMGQRDLRRLTGWGGSRADRFLVEVAEWDRVKAGSAPGQGRVKAGSAPGQEQVNTGSAGTGQSSKKERSRVKAGSAPGQHRVSTGSDPGQEQVNTGSVVPENLPPPPEIAAPKIDRSEKERSDSLSPTPLSEGGERERPASPFAQKLPPRLVAALAAGGIVDEATLRGRTDAEIRYLPGVGEAGLATVRAAFPPGTAPKTPREKALEILNKKFGPKEVINA